MIYALLGDVHGNLEALTAVFAALEGLAVDRVLQVGDVVGYGADPGACIDRLRDEQALVVAGNHDWAVLERTDSRLFNPQARRAVHWTRGVLDRGHREWLAALPLLIEIDDLVTLTHATPSDPDAFEYLMTYESVRRSLASLRTQIGVIGHSHVPCAFLEGDELLHTEDPSFEFTGWHRCLLNVGSVGQPRDGDPRACLGLLDTDRGEYRLQRVPYDVEQAALKIRLAGLPPSLGERLFLGE